MIRSGTFYSKHRVAAKAARLATEGALAKAGISKCSIAFVFATTEYRRFYREVLKMIRQISGARDIVGVSAFGVLTEEIEIEQQPGLAVMAIQDESIQSKSFLVSNLQENNFRAGEKVASLIQGCGIENPNLFLFPDPFSFQSHLFFEGFETAGAYLPLLGGLASEKGQEDKTYQLEGQEVTYDAIAGIAVGGGIRIESDLARSCQPFGEPFRVTKADGHRIYEIDGRPAYDILLESISRMNIQKTDQIFHQIFLGMPTRSFQTDFTQSPYLIRNILEVNAKKGMLSCIAPVEEGEFITFTLRNPEYAIENMGQMLENLRMRIAPHQPSFGLYFNSCTRGKSLYEEPNSDVREIQKHFPDVPLIGFFDYGEIAPLDYVNHLHHYSGVLAFGFGI